MDGNNLGKWIVFVGICIICLGLVVWALTKVGFPFGNLPGDIQVKGEHSHLYFPIVTSIILSIILTIGINLLLWVFRK